MTPRFVPFALALCAGCVLSSWSPPRRDGSVDTGDVSLDRSFDDRADSAPDSVADVASDLPPDRGCPFGALLCGEVCTPVTSDPNHCGSCTTRCALPNATVACIAGVCRLSGCAAGFADCDTAPANGCEADLRTAETCGSCARHCAAMEVCSGTTCMLTCPPGQTVCSGACVALASDTANCGACGRTCNATNGTAACMGGVCAITCAAGFGNCDGSLTNGCEADLRTSLSHCGTCGNACPPRASATAACTTGACTYTCSSPNYGDCNGTSADGCETYLLSAVTHCGNCATACTTDSGTSMNRCIGGTCRPTCASGFADCDGNPANGCETPTTTTANCGTCGTACGAGFSCARTGASSYACTASCGEPGQACCTTTTPPCRVGACASGMCCSLSQTSCGGACVNTSTSASNCGACGTVCAITPETPVNGCTGGACVPVCAPGFGNCDAMGANGCETALTTDAHCGGCSTSCAPSTTCVVAGGVPGCTACGATGQPCCTAGAACATGMCVTGTCR